MKIMTLSAFIKEKAAVMKKNDDRKLDDDVLNIIQTVRREGDRALLNYTRQFDRVDLQTFTVTEEEMALAKQEITSEFLEALNGAKQQIIHFHKNQLEKSWFIEGEDGTLLGQKVTPLESAGVYIPGGKAAYPSTVLMNVLPAKIAGVKQIIMVTPPDEDGRIRSEVLVAAHIAGVDQIYKVGGAQAIAALAYGTETIQKVNKIVGPGNRYVARAKKWVYGDVAIDMIAGPSEVVIVADDTAPPHYVAADLLAQAEHDEDATAILITYSKKIALTVQKEVEKQLQLLERKAMINESLEKNGRIIVVDSLKEALQLVNKIAPEHLQLMIENPMEKLPLVKHAGAIFLGNDSPEALGDYYAGPNHTLPTSGTAVFSSPLGVYDFLKKSSVIYYSEAALNKSIDSIVTLAKAEGLTAHAKSIQVRRKENGKKK
ncbi:histidinol dehydrogenase [Cerasibacillus quisquiliarum]|uniref:Histidinol dehydrogenase n=1 Tax=Cerasibacillus quisquiliarum TaxID=227865 RepID=A0A511V1Y5_9BACI|nr:histidinol dehydrogenase [Cerasibacillus quisquiliarum]MBB5146654.1 histidinol dehydrogenase [Cerasibacillus quisquiliarum]GEN31352.1 histidinol dehydrogenase [Cerasibacillus quisquiliarum]